MIYKMISAVIFDGVAVEVVDIDDQNGLIVWGYSPIGFARSSDL